MISFAVVTKSFLQKKLKDADSFFLTKIDSSYTIVYYQFNVSQQQIPDSLYGVEWALLHAYPAPDAEQLGDRGRLLPLDLGGRPRRGRQLLHLHALLAHPHHGAEADALVAAPEKTQSKLK